MKVEVAVLGSRDVPNNPRSLSISTLKEALPELRSCVKVEVAVLGSWDLSNNPHGLCGREAALNLTLQYHIEDLCRSMTMSTTC